MIKPHKIYEVYQDRRNLYTKNITPGKIFFNEKTTKQGSDEFREWEPKRSKLAALIVKKADNTFIRKDSVILYLGASHGYTPSFVSDIVGKNGFIFAIDHAPRVLRDLVFLAEERSNIAPIMGDANQPQTYLNKVSQVDVVYQDLAQRNQAEIFLKNVDLYLKKGGYALLAVKARSIDVKTKPKIIFEQVRKILEKKLTVVDLKKLEPFQLDHCMIICKK